jgi:hypothetical protein
VIGRQARDRRGRLRDIQAIQAVGIALEATPRRKLPRIPQVRRALRRQEVGIERDHDIGAGEIVERLHILPGGHPQSRPGVVGGRHGFPLDPPRPRVRGEHLLDLGRQGRRGDRFGQDPQARALGDRLRGQPRAHRRDEGTPRSNLAQLHHRSRAIGVVQRQHRGLRIQIGRAEAAGVIGIAFDLRRAPLVAFDEQPGRHAAERHRGRVVLRSTRDLVFRLPHVRHDQLGGLRRARGPDAGQRERRAHQLEKGSPADRVEPLRRVLRKFAVEVFLELRCIGHGLETAPIRLPAGPAHPLADLGQIRCPRLLHWFLQSKNRSLAGHSWRTRPHPAAPGRTRRTCPHPSPVADRATRHVPGIGNPVITHQPLADVALTALRLVSHLKHRLPRAHEPRRIAVAIEAPLHLQ